MIRIITLLFFALLSLRPADLMRVLITGSSRGIGLGLCRHFLERSDVSEVIATARRPETSVELSLLAGSSSGRLKVVPLDVCDESSQTALVSKLKEEGITSIDILICNHGISNPDHPDDPVLQTSEADMMSVFQTNVVGTLLTLQSLSQLLCSSRARLCVVMSSRLASIEECSRLGGYTSYRASKAALNMLVSTYIGDPAVKAAGVRALLLHPGWVQTDMGGAKGRKAHLTVDQSVDGLLSQVFRAVAVQLSPAPSSPSEAGGVGSFESTLRKEGIAFVSYDGEMLPF